MIKHILVTMAIAAVAGLIGHAWRVDALPGDPGSPVTAAAPQGTALGATPAPVEAAACKEAGTPRDATTSAEACLLDAALADNDEARVAALRQAAQLVLGEDAAMADFLLMTAAARGDLQALADFAAVQGTSAEDALLRREAALMAAGGGSADARAGLDRLRAGYRAQALSEPEMLWTLLEGRGLELADRMKTRRYLLGLAAGYQQSCPFQSAMWESAGFAKAQEQYAAPVNASSHVQVASSAGEAISRGVMAVSQFVRRMEQGAPYTDAGAGLMRDLRDAQRQYNTQVSRVSEAGARDGVRIAELMAGCSSVDGTRLTRALMDVFAARARQAPTVDG